MKDFNEVLAKEREFRVQDQTFKWQDVRPEVLSTFDLDINGNENPNAVWELMDKQIVLFLAPEDQKRWKELREREDSPVTIAQMNSLLTWLMEEQTGRPTEAPSPSDSGRGRTAASSKGA